MIADKQALSAANSKDDDARPDLLAAMLDALPAAIAVVDEHGRQLAANRAWNDLMSPRSPREQPAGQPVSRFRRCLPPFASVYQSEQITDGIRAVLDAASPAFYTEIKDSRADDVAWYGIDVRPLGLRNAAVMITCRDVSDKRADRQSLQESRDHLYQAQKMEALGTLVAGVAHEINNPISLMMFNLPIVRRVWQDVLPVLDRQAADAGDRKFGGFTMAYLQTHFQRLIDDMDMAASRVSKIVKDLKNFSRQSQVSDKQPLQINEAVTNAVRLARITIQKSGVKLALDLQERLPAVYGNLPSIEQIVLNILINAVQAIDAEQGTIRISTGYQASDATVYVAVSDNGRGVSAAIADKVFDPFVTDKQTSGGSGLGLAVSYSLVQAHGGAITFAAAPEGGTTFTIRLPSMRKEIVKRVLVVDDDAMVRQLVVQMLSKTQRYHVEEAASGIDGLLRIGTKTPDLLILDLKMPGMNGLEVCRAIRRNEQLADMKVLITTGHPSHPDLTEIRAMGYTDCYVKPLQTARFREMVDKMMASPRSAG